MNMYIIVFIILFSFSIFIFIWLPCASECKTWYAQCPKMYDFVGFYVDGGYAIWFSFDENVVFFLSINRMQFHKTKIRMANQVQSHQVVNKMIEKNITHKNWNSI